MWGWIAADAVAYTYHRAAHGFKFHQRHHSHPEDRQIMARASVASGLTFAAAATVTGYYRPMAVYWLAATAMHPLLHRGDNKWIPTYLRERHESHHKDPSTKFGPLHPAWDLLCNTESRK